MTEEKSTTQVSDERNGITAKELLKKAIDYICKERSVPNPWSAIEEKLNPSNLKNACEDIHSFLCSADLDWKAHPDRKNLEFKQEEKKKKFQTLFENTWCYEEYLNTVQASVQRPSFGYDGCYLKGAEICKTCEHQDYMYYNELDHLLTRLAFLAANKPQSVPFDKRCESGLFFVASDIMKKTENEEETKKDWEKLVEQLCNAVKSESPKKAEVNDVKGKIITALRTIKE